VITRLAIRSCPPCLHTAQGALGGDSHTHSSTRRLKMQHTLVSSWHETAERQGRGVAWRAVSIVSMIYFWAGTGVT
jgi:hypothetical protein